MSKNRGRVEVPDDTLVSRIPQMRDLKTRDEDMVLIITAMKDIAWQCDQVYSLAIESIQDNVDIIVEQHMKTLEHVRDLTDSLSSYLLRDDWKNEKKKMVTDITLGALLVDYYKSNKIKSILIASAVIVLLPLLQNVAKAILVGMANKIFGIDLISLIPLLFGG